MGLQRINLSRRRERAAGNAPGRLRGVDERLPRHWRCERRDMEIEIFVIGVDHDKKTLVDVALAARGEEFACRPAQNIAKRQRYRIIPIVAGRFFTRWSDPGDVFDPGLGEHLSAKKARAREHAMATAKVDQIADETAEILVFGSDMLPVEPRDLVVLTIRVVVAALSPADLVAGEQHRNAEDRKSTRLNSS